MEYENMVFLRDNIALSPRPEHSGAISAHYHLLLPYSGDSHASASQISGVTGNMSYSSFYPQALCNV